VAIEVFNRYEHKYMLDRQTFEKVIRVLDEHMIMDSHNKDHTPYTISNIYYDTYALMQQIPTYKTDYDSIESKFIPDYKYKFNYQDQLMHNKFFIFDNKRVLTGSANISSYCLTGFNSNIAVLINSEQVAKVYSQEFEQMYKYLRALQSAYLSSSKSLVWEWELWRTSVLALLRAK